MKTTPHYLLIGNGRVAAHMRHYFSHLKLSYSTWTRQHTQQTLNSLLANATHILILIQDQVIETFIKDVLSHIKIPIIHFSGSLISELAYGAHPLMCFSTDLYPNFDIYSQFPFVVDDDAPPFEVLLPGMPNPHVRLHKSLKPRYHALCVLAGNLSCMLWQKLFNSLEEEFKFPSAIAHPYLLQQTQNLIHDSNSALTGPLIRNDLVTMERNLIALNNDPFRSVYQSFVTCYEQMKRK